MGLPERSTLSWPSRRSGRPGTKMAFAGIKQPEERADVILYLRSLVERAGAAAVNRLAAGGARGA